MTLPILDEEALTYSNESLNRDPRWLLALRITLSKGFEKSPFLASFLLDVCDRELRGKSEEITEYQIGVRAFGRPENYNPSVDNIVRTYARLLRKRLDEFYEAEGRDESIRISIPRGGYVPIFDRWDRTEILQTRPPMAHATPDLTESYGTAPVLSEAAVSARRGFSRWLLLLVPVLVALTVGRYGPEAYGWLRPTLAHRFWGEVFNRSRQTLIVPADSGFGIVQNLTAHPVHLGDYVTGTYLSEDWRAPGIDASNWNDLRNQRYTSIVDLDIALRLSRVPEVVPEHFEVRYARDVRMEDLKRSDAILLGSIHTNPWAELFQDQLNFVLDYQPSVDDSSVINRHPLPSESSIYKNASADDFHRTYTVLAFLPSLDGAGHVILLEGLNMAGTQAAADFLLSEQAMEPVLQKAKASDGSIQSFELLLETSSIGATASKARVVAERYGSR